MSFVSMWRGFKVYFPAVENGLGARRALMELSRDEIQDKHLRLMEENVASRYFCVPFFMACSEACNNQQTWYKDN